MRSRTVLVTTSVDPEQKRLIEEQLPTDVACLYLDALDAVDREAAVADADALISFRPFQELAGSEVRRLHSGQVVQVISAGVDHVDLDRLPDGVVLQSNAGAYAESVAEHALALYLALSKRLPIEKRSLREGEFNKFRSNDRIDGSTVGIVGFGEIGRATARLLEPLGASVLAINRSGEADRPVEFLGSPDDLQFVLRESDGVVLAAPLTAETRGLVDREKLEWMGDSGILVNVARAELVDQEALWHHLRANPRFRAGIDVWWDEPTGDGEFDPEYPFPDLPNVLGSPHNAAQVPGSRADGLSRAVDRVVDSITDGEYTNVVDLDRRY